MPLAAWPAARFAFRASATSRLEALDVECVGLGNRDVTRSPRLDDPVPQDLPKLGHVDLDDSHAARRGLITPHLVEQLIGRDDLVGSKQQRGQERSLPGAAERE